MLFLFSEKSDCPNTTKDMSISVTEVQKVDRWVVDIIACFVCSCVKKLYCPSPVKNVNHLLTLVLVLHWIRQTMILGEWCCSLWIVPPVFIFKRIYPLVLYSNKSGHAANTEGMDVLSVTSEHFKSTTQEASDERACLFIIHNLKTLFWKLSAFFGQTKRCIF